MSETIELPESLTIHHIEALYNELNEKFNNSEEQITLQGAGIESIDTSGLQALLILISSARDNGKTVQWESSSETLITSAQNIGLAEPLALN